MNLTDLLGSNDANWANHPDRPCAAPSDKALDIRYHADRWFPSQHVGNEYAQAVCKGCPVVKECFLAAMADPTLEGIWGATTEQDRRALRRKNKEAAA